MKGGFQSGRWAAVNYGRGLTPTTVNNAHALPSRALHLPHMTTRPNTTNTDLVEDSEPERKRIRLRNDQTKRRRTHPPLEQHQHGDGPPPLSSTPTRHHSADSDNFCLGD